jgi:hypothetical protein
MGHGFIFVDKLYLLTPLLHVIIRLEWVGTDTLAY